MATKPNDGLINFHNNPSQSIQTHAPMTTVTTRSLAHALLSASVPRGDLTSEVPTSLLLGVAGRLWKLAVQVDDLEDTLKKMKDPDFLRTEAPEVIYVTEAGERAISTSWIHFIKIHSNLSEKEILEEGMRYFYDNVLTPFENATTIWTTNILDDYRLVKVGDIAAPVMSLERIDGVPCLCNAWVEEFQKRRTKLTVAYAYYAEMVGNRYVAAMVATEKEKDAPVKVTMSGFQYQIPHYEGAPLGPDYYLPAETK